VSSLVSTFVRAFCSRDGLRVRVSRGARTEILPSRFSQTASISAKQLARGGTVELTETDFESPSRPLFWVASRAGAPDGSGAEDDKVRLSFGWCIGRPRTEPAALAIAEAMSAMIEAAVDAKDCVAALVTAQGRSLAMADAALPYELMSKADGHADDAGWLRAHVRSPGWQVLVPRARTKALSKKAPTSVSLVRVRAGLLVRTDAPTPFAMDTMAELETWLRPVLGP
jgi:hypothetical protein